MSRDTQKDKKRAEGRGGRGREADKHANRQAGEQAGTQTDTGIQREAHSSRIVAAFNSKVIIAVPVVVS